MFGSSSKIFVISRFTSFADALMKTPWVFDSFRKSFVRDMIENKPFLWSWRIVSRIHCKLIHRHHFPIFVHSFECSKSEMERYISYKI